VVHLRRRTVVVPLVACEMPGHSLGLACQLAPGRRARVLLVAPVFVDLEFPLDAHLHKEEKVVRAELRRAYAVARSYGGRPRRRIVRIRRGQLGIAVAQAASEARADLIVVDASAGTLSHDVRSILAGAPCRVLVASVPNA
jgi:hypothetical protein